MRVDPTKDQNAAELHKMLCAWRQAAAMLQAGEISREDYNRWRYNYPKFDNTQTWAKTPSKELRDFIIERLFGQLGNCGVIYGSGGKTSDTVKAAAYYAQCPVIIVPPPLTPLAAIFR